MTFSRPSALPDQDGPFSLGCKEPIGPICEQAKHRGLGQFWILDFGLIPSAARAGWKMSCVNPKSKIQNPKSP
jgi:hypothetical protein